MSDIPESNIGREYKSLTLGELFERNKFGEPIRFDSRYDRTHGILEYRIPEHQRHPKWSLVKKQKLLDSVFRNYTMSGFVTTEHFDIQQNKKLKTTCWRTVSTAENALCCGCTPRGDSVLSSLGRHATSSAPSIPGRRITCGRAVPNFSRS